ncbi:MAG: hypothetical protein PHP98_10495 [Kiritimatiellae bacterium]|nr:hypothetical protein [Kiritimatiellia bacterium]
MLDFAAVRNNIQAGLQAYLREAYDGILVVFVNPEAPEPPQPYITMNFTSLYIPEPGRAPEFEEIVPYDPSRWGHDPPKDFESDVRITRRSNDEMVCSFTVHAADRDQSHAIGLAAIRWFEVDGYGWLKNRGIIPAEIMALTSRDAYLIDAWQRRVGFDVRFRVTSSIARYSDTIETADIQRKE